MRNPVVYFFCPDYGEAVGGVKVIYRHVDILNRNGIEACVLHSKKGFRCGWFRNETPIACVAETKFNPEDILVFPESLLAFFTDAHNPSGIRLRLNRVVAKSRHKYYINELSKTPVRKVIFNQNAFLTFKGLDYLQDYDIPYLRKDVIATICVSDNNFEYLRYAFPRIQLFRVRLSSGSDEFRLPESKKRQIAFMVNRNREDLNQVLNLLKVKNIADGFDIVPIQDKTEQQVAGILRDSLLFLNFGRAEGFSLPPFEAMLCGCVVIGFHGGGGGEFFRPEFSYPLESGDIIGFARKVEEVVSAYRTDPARVLDMGKRASEYIASHYSARIETEYLVQAWSEIIKIGI